MVMVTVDSKASLNTIGTNAKTAATYYRDATTEADRSFKMRTEGSEGSALSAFVEKINALSTYVFAVYPDLLDRLGEELVGYSGKLEGEGFDEVTYTSDAGISNIQDWLKRQRYDSIERKEKTRSARQSCKGCPSIGNQYSGPGFLKCCFAGK
ncbi:hypothetical protein [Streptococcus sp. DD12]|uniref:hypothetical protein n=1 Tax=Streptococcus sp. DD12 TaxID=1777880 RepID=UPI000794E3A9|nr:hypothetical protein [Streptococcus sp. DD12]KXT75480.1 hypothetical protein STRDD12_01291 [Streptococcus sp. DD12]